MKFLIVITTIFISTCSLFQAKNLEIQQCRGDRETFLNKVGDMDLSIFYGISLDSRGYDVKGNKYIGPIEYQNIAKQKIRLPSLQETGNNTYPSLDNYDYYSYAKEMRVDSSVAKEFTTNRINKMVNSYNDFDIIGINSQPHLGEFIRFDINTSCSVWYKKDNAVLDKNFTTYFKESDTLKQNWYVLNIRNLAPVLKEHPSNVRLDK